MRWHPGDQVSRWGYHGARMRPNAVPMAKAKGGQCLAACKDFLEAADHIEVVNQQVDAYSKGRGSL